MNTPENSAEVGIDVRRLVRCLPESTKNELLEKLIVGMRAVEDTMAESIGIYGLPLNGDGAEWCELMNGGRFCEWLEPFNDGIIRIDEVTNEFYSANVEMNHE
jgi:hypothetical protein